MRGIVQMYHDMPMASKLAVNYLLAVAAVAIIGAASILAVELYRSATMTSESCATEVSDHKVMCLLTRDRIECRQWQNLMDECATAFPGYDQ